MNQKFFEIITWNWRFLQKSGKLAQGSSSPRAACVLWCVWALYIEYRRTHSIRPANVKNRRKKFCSYRASTWYFHCYDSYVEVVFWIFLAHPLFSTPTHNHKPQTTTEPTTQHNHHDEVWKNGIPYALGLTRSIAHRQNCLVNRNLDIVVEMTLHVGIK